MQKSATAGTLVQWEVWDLWHLGHVFNKCNFVNLPEIFAASNKTRLQKWDWNLFPDETTHIKFNNVRRKGFRM